MRKNSILVKQVLMSIVTVGTMAIAITACTDEIDNPVAEETPQVGFTGFGASADMYNINDETFTAETWRQEPAIYLYDEEGRQKDPMGRKGYTLVNLPWIKSDVQTNLPDGFCKDVTRENGWELVLNRCGCRSIKNNNFFALYNKYTGILRFFFYMPDKFQTGNDHVWEVTMTENMSTNMGLRYGRTQDCKNMNRQAIGLDAGSTVSKLGSIGANALTHGSRHRQEARMGSRVQHQHRHLPQSLLYGDGC